MFQITKDELEETQRTLRLYGCNGLATALGENVSSRPALSPRIDVSKCFEDIIYSSSPWKIYRQDAGMGEHDYAVFLDDVFYCRTEDSQTAMRIVNTMRRTEGGDEL
jgi:hypothetical protein